MSDDHDDDAVGFKRPPRRTRFRPGRSGNPTGRPKRRPSFRAALLAELASPMPGTDRRRVGSKLHALVRTLVDAAIACDARAQSVLIGALTRIGDVDEHEPASLTPEDQEILDAYVGDELKRRGGEPDATPADGEHHED
jgi:hypothetical protein